MLCIGIFVIKALLVVLLKDVKIVASLNVAQPCPKDQVWDNCYTACPPTCNPPPGPVACPAVCVVGCRCKNSKPIPLMGPDGKIHKCISRDQCCKGGQVWKPCGSACDRTCANPDPICTEQCVPRCECPQDTLQDYDVYGNLRCIKRDQCCPGDLVWNDCGSACTRTCSNPNPICIALCVSKCECPRKTPFQVGRSKCKRRCKCKNNKGWKSVSVEVSTKSKPCKGCTCNRLRRRGYLEEACNKNIENVAKICCAACKANGYDYIPS